MKHLPILFLLFVGNSFVFGQTFLNGSFENNGVTNCMINNITNAQFNALMNDAKGIGLTETIDIFYDTDCPEYGPAQSGHYFVSLENNSSDPTLSTVISLKLSDPLQEGNNYSLSFYDMGLSVGAGPVVIGLSDNDATFGTVIYTAPPVHKNWTLRTISFSAPTTAQYITVKYGSSLGGAFVDNFEISSALGVDNLTETQKLKIYPNPFSDQITFDTATNEPTTITLYDSLGQQILQKSFLNDTTINTEQLSTGIYLYEIKNTKQIVAKGKVVKT